VLGGPRGEADCSRRTGSVAAGKGRSVCDGDPKSPAQHQSSQNECKQLSHAGLSPPRMPAPVICAAPVVCENRQSSCSVPRSQTALWLNFGQVPRRPAPASLLQSRRKRTGDEIGAGQPDQDAQPEEAGGIAATSPETSRRSCASSGSR